MGHELEVVHHILVLFRGVLFKFGQLGQEDSPMRCELWFILVRLPLYLILEFCKCVGLLKFVKAQSVTFL